MVSSWGRLSHDQHTLINLSDASSVSEQLQNNHPGVAYGMGRSYGDACLNPQGILWGMHTLDRFISFDQSSGILRCEAGVLLRDIQQLFVSRGWMLAVTPGTQLVTVGGAIANDVHGKNHHAFGSFGEHVRWLKLMRTDGTIVECGPNLLPDWFAATVGGIGLTGVIVQVEIQLRRVAGPWLDAQTIPFYNLSEFIALTEVSASSWEHTVAWIDCLSGKQSRGVFMRANCAQKNYTKKLPGNKKISMPFVPPISLVNKLSLRAFNTLYFNVQEWKKKQSTVHYEPFFYPLDNILAWNKMYGPKGFFQYQTVVPMDVGQDAIQAMLHEIKSSGEGSFLAVLKTFGNRQSVGMMSFARAGITLALDFSNHNDKTQKLFTRLDAIVREAKGCIYLAKDARMPRDIFELGYPRLSQFLQYRDPGISSLMSRRLIGS